MEIDAAVINEKSGPFTIETLELEEPQDGEILIRVVAVGLCHTDIAVRDQYYPTPLPAVLGHEGSGIVEKVGDDVTRVEPGDRVVLTFDFDDECSNCRTGHPAYCENFFEHNFMGRRVSDGLTPIHDDGEDISGMFFGQSSFATHAIATETNVVPIEDDVPLELLGPLGCGIQTGAGSVINTLDVQAGSSIVVFGAGSVGLSAIMAADLRGSTDIIAVDLLESRREKALELGATSTINPEAVDDTEETIREHLGDGAQYSVETTSHPHVFRTAVDSLRQTGECAVIGAPPLGTEVELDVNTILFGRNIKGVVEGDSTPETFIPTLIDLYRADKFPFDELVTYYDFENIENAVEDQEAGEVIKPILRISEP